jgi:hypothetical protein
MGLSHSVPASMKDWYTALHKIFAPACVAMQRASEAASNGQVQDMCDLVDAAFLLKKLAEMADDLKKEANRSRDVIEKQCCQQWLVDMSTKLDADDVIRGVLASGKPKPRIVPIIPKAGTPEYESLCLDMGLSPDFSDGYMFHIHWPHFVEWCNKQLEAGKKLPAAVAKNNYPQNQFQWDEEKDFELALRKAV